MRMHIGPDSEAARIKVYRVVNPFPVSTLSGSPKWPAALDRR